MPTDQTLLLISKIEALREATIARVLGRTIDGRDSKKVEAERWTSVYEAIKLLAVAPPPPAAVPEEVGKLLGEAEAWMQEPYNPFNENIGDFVDRGTGIMRRLAAAFGPPTALALLDRAERLERVRAIIGAFSDLAADPGLWRALTDEAPSAHAALSLIDAALESPPHD